MSARILLLMLAAAAVAEPQEQPVPFSHKTHTGTAKMACQDCHTRPEKFGAEMEFPAVSKCMACHVLIAKDKPEIRKLAGYAAAKQPVPWARVYRLKDFVFFDHRFHLQNEAVCADCHGAVASQDVVADELHSTTMAFCQACHTKTQASRGCGTCHNIR